MEYLLIGLGLYVVACFAAPIVSCIIGIVSPLWAGLGDGKDDKGGE